MPDRIGRLLQDLDIARPGLELGPLTNPVLRRPGANVLYVDHLDTDGLRRKYAGDPHVDTDAIVPVDVVWTDGALQDRLPPGSGGFDHIVASHMIEHVPDIVWWLREISAVLAPAGALRLIVPDRRFTMDIARRESGLADALAAFVEGRRVPAPREIIDFYVNYRSVDVAAAWRGLAPGPDATAQHNVVHAVRLAGEALAGAHHDVHCWVFTPPSFARLLGNLARAGLCDFACEGLDPPVAGELDFFARLRRADDPSAVVASWDAAEARARAEDPVLPQNA